MSRFGPPARANPIDSEGHARCSRAPAMMRLWVLGFLGITGCEKTFDCEKLVPNVQLHVVDAAASTPVLSPTFSEGTTAIEANCQSPPDAGEACATWQLLVVGMRTITVAAPGYQSKMLTLDAGVDQSSLHCGANAGPARRLEQTVQLTHN